jgi:glycine betaine/proline transport system substrate-binding protein
MGRSFLVFKIMRYCRSKWGLCLGLGLIFVFLLTIAGCGGAEDSKPRLTFADVSWDSVQVHNRIAGFIVQHGYEYPEPRYVFGESLPLVQGLGNGDVDVLMENWIDNWQEAWDKVMARGTAIDLGPNFPDSTQGWYVPTYVIKGDKERGIEPMAPDLKTVEDMPKYWELFQNPQIPGKGCFYNSPPGWMCTEINEIKFDAYGLNENYELFGTGSQSSLAASMVAAYEKGKPWIGYYWEPTWVMGKLDMTLIEEAPYDEEVWENTKACAYPPSVVNIAVHGDMQEKAPEVVEFLKKYTTTTAQNNEVLAYMDDTGGDAEAGAIWFLKEYPEVWKKWVPEDVATRVEKALGEVN